MTGTIRANPQRQSSGKGFPIGHTCKTLWLYLLKNMTGCGCPRGLTSVRPECRVYAYVYGLTESKCAKTKGYNGSVRQLARSLGLSLGTASTVLRDLQEEQLISKQDGVYKSVQSVNSSVQPMNDNVQPMNESVQLLNPRTPIYINNEKREGDDETRHQRCRAQDTEISSQPLSSFDELIKAYRAQNDNATLSADVLATSRSLWGQLDEGKQQQLLQAVEEGKWSKSRLDWTITDYKFREPTNYNGRVLPQGFEFYRADYNGQRGLFTKQDVEAYKLQNTEFFVRT